MTDEQLREIEQRANVATLGPWVFVPHFNCVWHESSAGAGHICDVPDGDERDNDMNFIAAARSDVPALIAEVRRLKSSNDMFASFGRAVMKNIYDAGDWWADDALNEYVLPIAEQHGLVMRVPYDPAIHGDGIDADEGDEIWWIDTAVWPASSAEIERLRVEIEGLLPLMEKSSAYIDELCDERAKLRADIERLGAERDQLVAALYLLFSPLARYATQRLLCCISWKWPVYPTAALDSSIIQSIRYNSAGVSGFSRRRLSMNCSDHFAIANSNS